MKNPNETRSEEQPRDGYPQRVRLLARCAGELLLEVGAAPHTQGFRMLQYGMMLLSEQPIEVHIGLKNSLYPLLEELTGRPSAEHAIRDTIRLSWQRKPAPPFAALFPSERVPSNAQYLYAMSALLKKRMREPDRYTEPR